ncbi:MAG: IgGFc-binding protein [Deltaproteobacteria bacterium]|nr:IgGFc-binding protein [Deltaproteobacteria bacterium]
MRSVLLTIQVFAVCGLALSCSSASNNNDGDDDDPGDAGGDTDSDTSACDEEGAGECFYNEHYSCQDGSWVFEESCEVICDPELGCVICEAGEAYCEGEVAMQCAADGQSTEVIQDCAADGLTCIGGECVSNDPCVQAMAESSNIGCEYWAVDLDNAENAFDDAAAAQFAVAVANIGSFGSAHVEVHLNNAPQGQELDLELVEEHDVEELGLHIFRLPRRDADGDNVTDNVDDGPQTWLSSRAFRITADVPIVAYQFNPLDQQFSNDASLLIPTSGVGKDYVILGYPPHSPTSAAMSPKTRGYITVLGIHEQTEVAVDVTAAVQAGIGVDEIPAGGSAVFNIGPFDVLNLETKLYTIAELIGGVSVDFSGSTVIADKPVAVFFGTDMSMVGEESVEDSCCAEHIEQQVLPSGAMGQQFVVTHSAQRNSGTAEMDYYRIMAYETATVTTNLSAPNDSFTLAAGEYRDFFTNKGFTVETTDGYLHVAQFLVDAGNTSAYIGDTALLYFPAVDQRRGLYVFTTGEGFSRNAAVISMPQGTEVLIDGNDVATTCSGPSIDGTIGLTTYVSYTCDIEDGAHMVHSGETPEEADTPIAVTVYGYYSAGSYAYPAGSDLRHINPAVPE